MPTTNMKEHALSGGTEDLNEDKCYNPKLIKAVPTHMVIGEQQ